MILNALDPFYSTTEVHSLLIIDTLRNHFFLLNKVLCYDALYIYLHNIFVVKLLNYGFTLVVCYCNYLLGSASLILYFFVPLETSHLYYQKYTERLPEHKDSSILYVFKNIYT